MPDGEISIKIVLLGEQLLVAWHESVVFVVLMLNFDDTTKLKLTDGEW